MKRMLFALALFAANGALFAPVAHAAELPTGVFQMHDGTYFYPADGFLSANLDEMLSHIGAATTTQTTTSTTGEQTPPPVPVRFPLKNAILRAQDLLTASTTPPHVEKTDTGWRTITLAIWNPAADAIRTVTLDKKGTSLRAIRDSIAGVHVIRSNGLNSEFSVAGGDIVVAIRYPIYADRKISKKKTVYDVSDAIYTPYSRALHTPEMIAEGKRWFGETVSGVFDSLRSDAVPSRAFPSKLLADAIDPNFVKSIAIIEHIDDSAFRQDPTRQIEAFFVTLAANEDDAYDYAKSTAGALGLAQFIPKTYAALAKWPTLNLEKNFEVGMRDPKNAIRAQAAYLDYLRACLQDAAIAATGTNPNRSNEYVAAAYNGGATRAAKAMAVWDENLDPNQRLHVKSRSRLKLETMRYVLKLRTVQQLGIL